jgi:hypothetical protein
MQPLKVKIFQEAETGDYEFKASLGLNSEICFKKKR